MIRSIGTSLETKKKKNRLNSYCFLRDGKRQKIVASNPQFIKNDKSLVADVNSIVTSYHEK